MNSPGSTSRIKLAPTMSSAADSLATTQPVSNFPITRGRIPWRSRAAYKVFSSINIKENAPCNVGKIESAFASTLPLFSSEINAVIISVSVVAWR